MLTGRLRIDPDIVERSAGGRQSPVSGSEPDADAYGLVVVKPHPARIRLRTLAESPLHEIPAFQVHRLAAG